MSNELTPEEKEAQKLILGEINKAFDLLEKHLHTYCNEVAPQFTGNKSTVVPMVYISQSIKVIKENLAKGAGIE